MIRRPTPDIRFARRVLGTIRSLPDHSRYPGLGWDQWVYRVVDVRNVVHAEDGTPVCRTTMCFAGWVVELDRDVDWAYDSVTLRTLFLNDDTVSPPIQLSPDLTTARDLTTGANLTAHEYAERRLGLTARQSVELFLATSSLDDLAEALDRIERGTL
ncbi:hypothetical protein [Nocardia lijiangensis]|uniref:hypothetical protein n=1 Tax=Nocardia lijiangensis TaxID=299618 RepID=UPI00082EE838|nr:hypothetical protein [Nocardia lijiangensis]